MKKRHWKIRLKERTTGHICTPEHIGYLDRQGVIKFFGLDEPDIEWYDIQEVPYNETENQPINNN